MIDNLLTEKELELTAGMPDPVAAGYINARRRDGKGERRNRLVVIDGHVHELPTPSEGPFGGLFGTSFS
ncbi:hypothetical protein [Mycolicibacterium sp. F2034L]|uniref:hypothetical protein n=1 Tax=Mycolicibacterium sp. F2034L TaxID=2926422 RepID=UPI001FF2BE7E|nr:hypothetical protein [Mycolicibacterium sp. F2034L]MCK0174784.1 hypothetical protein [Mycolicibacterium sp. F2034L]